MSIESVTIALLLVLSAFLAAVALLACLRARSWRMALVASGFILFLLKALLLSAFLFRDDLMAVRTLLILATLGDSLALAMLYLGVLKR